MKIFDANVKIILDSRGKETLGAELKTDKFSGSASVPTGKSTGTHEAFVLEPKKALDKFQELKPKILNKEFKNQEDFDNFLISLDGTPNKQNLGGNLILALSLAFARLKAKNQNLELFQYVNRILNTKYKIQNTPPRPIFNVINGGAHANNSLAFQEYQIIPEVNDFGMALGLGQEFYEKLKQFLENNFGKENIALGDEAGFSCSFKNSIEPIEILSELIAKYHYPLRIGLDAAASQFFKNGKYTIDGKEYFAEELKDYYVKLIDAYNIISIEDPFYEESFDSFASLTADLRGLKLINADKIGINRYKSVLVITDDLTTTNPERLTRAIKERSGNTILIKLNQIGTLTETLKVVNLAYKNKWQAIVSHRSGETMDDFIADLAFGIGAWGLKSGAPAAPERMVKYNRILRIISNS
jgi:enolase